MANLQTILDQVKAVLNKTDGLQPSTLVFNLDHVPDTVKHKSYRLVLGSIQANSMSRGNGADTLCSEKTRALSVFVAIKNANNEQKAYEDLLRLEERIEDNLLKDPGAAGWINMLRNVETAPDPDNLFWIMEMVFDFDYERNF